LDAAQRLLLRDQLPVPLQPKAFDTLLVLVRNSEKVVLKDELLNAVWADTFVEESNLTQNIFVLRKALGDGDPGHRYIITVPGRGYRFAEAVRVIPEIAVNLNVTGLPEALHPPAAGEFPAPDPRSAPAPGPPALHTPRPRRATALALVTVGLLALFAGVLFYRHFSRVPRLIATTQVTHSARVDPWGRIFSDGSRLFVIERDGDHWNTVQVAAQGGETQPFLSTFHNTRIFAVSSRTSEMLIGPFVKRTGDLPLWSMPLVGGSPRRVGDIAVDDAEFSPDGATIAFSRGDAIYLSDTTGNSPRKLASCGGFCQSLAWSPNGKVIRFTQLADGDEERTSLWEVSLADGRLRPLFPGWHDPPAECCGRWTSDGRYYIFAAVRNGRNDIWALRESPRFLQFSPPQPVQLTQGPFGFGEPLPSRDGRTIYVQGGVEAADIERTDALTHLTKPLLHGLHAMDLSVSPDGQSAIYINDAVWRGRADGSAPQKLFQNTNSLRFRHARWYPDGKHLLLQGSGRGQPPEIYLVPSEGGALVDLLALGHPFIIPDVAPDGDTIVFGADPATAEKSPDQCVLTLFHVQSGEKSVIPGSQALLGATWSPDARYLAALSVDMTTMKLFDFATQRWSVIARGNYLTNPYWSADAKFVYFQDLLAPGEPVFRVPPGAPVPETVFSFEELLRSGPQRCLFIGLTLDGSLLTRVSRVGGDVYALDVELP
jgi:DNA-binding winged helix-turn-helix (wHTH) protein/Tol biopolymer transport system component